MNVGPIFDAWMGPFKDLGMKTVSPWDIGGADQLSFIQVGLPSFGFIQDPIEYESRTHHSSADVFDPVDRPICKASSPSPIQGHFARSNSDYWRP
jgi:hypothetical protein